MQPFTDNSALRSQLESQVDLMTAFSSKAVDVVRQLSELNMKLARQTMEASIYSSRELLHSDPALWMQTLMKQMQPAGERWRNYQQQLMKLLADAQADLANTAQARIPAAGRSASAAADGMVRGAAAGASAGAAAGANAAAASLAAGWPADQQPPGAPH